MGSGSSRSVTLADVSRVRNWLLVVLAHRAAPGDQKSLRSWLATHFQRHDTSTAGFVTVAAVAEIVSDLSLCPPGSSWTDAGVAQFSVFFAREEGDGAGNAFDYALFLDFVFFPVQPARPQLEISTQDTNADGFQVGIYRQCADSGQERSVVVKEAGLPASSTTIDELDALRDAVNSLRLLSHPNLVRYCSTLQCNGTLYVLQAHEPKCCSLRTILESFGPMKESTVRRYLAQILQGLSYLHTHGVPHGALSTHSVLIDSCGLLKLAGYGLCRFLPGSELWVRQSETPSARDDRDWCLQFKPPEVDGSTSWHHKSDVWSVGVLALQMTHGWCSAPPEGQTSTALRSPRSPSPTKRATIAGIDTTKATAVRRPPGLPATASKEIKALVRACLQKTPSKRPTAAELLHSPYFHVNQTDATREELRTVCTDLDASMRRLLSASSPATRAGIRKETHRRGTTGR